MDLLLTHHAAQILSVTPAAVRAMHNRGELPAEGVAGTVRLFDRGVVERVRLARAERRAGAGTPGREAGRR